MRSYASIRRKLTFLIAGGGIVAALIAAAGFSWLDLNRFQQNTNVLVTAIANIVAVQVEPSITLGDRKVAAEILNSLRSDRMIRDAVLYDGAGTCFAMARSSLSVCPVRPPDGLQREHDAIILVRPIMSERERIGTLLLAASVPTVTEVVRQYLGGAALIVALMLVGAAVLAVVLQSRVATPILTIASVAERISQTHHFQERVAVTSSDELGVLAESFNAMLDEIQRRDAKLEQQIVERNRVNAELLCAKERAEEAARVKGEFLANMSHEIRTPMNGVLGMISCVLDHEIDPEDREHLVVAKSAGEALVTILNDILDLSKIDAGKVSLEAVDFDVRQVAADALRIFESAVLVKSVELTVDFDRDCPRWVSGDPSRLRQILVNLVGNAVKFTAAGSVRLRLTPQPGNLIRFEVRDTGIGVPKDRMEAIFEAFTQADGSHSRRFGGTGLGLAITRRLVDLMGGRLWAESEPGQGSSFFVELRLPPVAMFQSEMFQAPCLLPETAVSPALPAALRVLVAEDNLVNQKVISIMLRRQGWTLTMAGNGEEAFQCFQQAPFDLVLMDVQMPEVDGLESTRRIREAESSRRLGRIPIMALTAHASEAQHELCLAAGMDAVIIKPVKLPTLLAQVAAVMAAAERA